MPSSAPKPERLVVVLGYSEGRSRDLHPICAARLEHAERLTEEGDAVLLSGFSRRRGRLPEAELMRRAWRGPVGGLLCDPDARRTAENAVNAVAHARELGVKEVVVVTSAWHRRRAAVLFRSLLPDVRVSVVAARTPGSPRVVMREAAAFSLVPLQLVRARRRARTLSGRSAAPA